MKTKPIYLDYQSTTPVDPEVLESMLPYFSNVFGNPSSKGHYYGRESSAAVSLSRKIISEFFESELEDIIFTSGATESINLAIKGYAEENYKNGNHIITSQIEHSAVLNTCKYLEKNGFEITYLPVISNGLINPDELKNSITEKTLLVSIQSSNNEIGVTQDIDTIAKICRKKNVVFHSDVTQSIGKENLDYKLFDMISLSGHKFYAPKGVGLLVIRSDSKRIKISTQTYGGGQEFGLRSGTLNVPYIVGIGKAFQLIQNNFDEHDRIISLRDRLFEGISSQIDNVYLNADKIKRLPNNLNIYIKDVKSNQLIDECKNICFSAAAACSTGSGKRSHVLKAIGLSDDKIDSSIRLSVGRHTTKMEIETAIEELVKSIIKIRNINKGL
ncbi:MAG: cysteine desulfurase family protein [Ignavibacteria bacterium]|nr:cysteine desulfurase family protein [Ignavibacteria bacterium]